MSDFNNLDILLDLNGIERDLLYDAIHRDIREIILKSIIERMKSDKGFFIKSKKYYFKGANLDAARKIVKATCDFSMSDEDIKWFDRCFIAFMKKKNSRAIIPYTRKKQLLVDQEWKCAKCGFPITLSNMHVDHIIPWDYVGDELKDNLQALCPDCNRHKSNHVAVTVSNIILKRRKAS